MTSAQRDEYRLTLADEERMADAIAAAIKGYGATNGGVYRVKSSDYPTLERIAAHAIGCSTFDLRDSELQWITNEIGQHELGI